jgi:AcrR family transcriptional regulator
MGSEKQHSKAEILAKTIPLFAAAGYSGVSMRQIAQTVGIKAASLYHYFPDKQSLYISALSQAFSKHADFMSESFTLSANPEICLHHLVKKLCILVGDDEDFRKLLHREMLDGDKHRLRLLADNVFGDFFRDLNDLCHSLSPGRDPHLMTVSILSMVIHHYQITPMRSFLPGFKPTHNDPQILAEHIFSLLKNGYT